MTPDPPHSMHLYTLRLAPTPSLVGCQLTTSPIPKSCRLSSSKPQPHPASSPIPLFHLPHVPWPGLPVHREPHFSQSLLNLLSCTLTFSKATKNDIMETRPAASTCRRIRQDTTTVVQTLRLLSLCQSSKTVTTAIPVPPLVASCSCLFVQADSTDRQQQSSIWKADTYTSVQPVPYKV